MKSNTVNVESLTGLSFVWINSKWSYCTDFRTLLKSGIRLLNKMPS